jgi:hypothetical protein
MVTIAFLSIFLFGLILAIVSWIVGELFEIGGEAAEGIGEIFGEAPDLALDAGTSGIDLAATGDALSPSPVSSRVIFSGLTAFGGFGVIGSVLGWPLGLTVLFALGGFVLASAGMFFGIVVPISRQQGSLKVVRTAYQGMEVQVGIGIPAEGVGQVTFEDPNTGALVTEAASSAHGKPIATGSQVRIIRVTGSGVVVEPVR